MKLVIAFCVVMVPAMVSAQHRGADSGGGGAAVSSSGAGGSSVGGGSSGSSSSSSGSGSSSFSSGGSSGSSGSAGHRTGNIVPPNPASANTSSGAFTNYSNLTFPAPEFARPRSSFPINTAFPNGTVPVFTPNSGNITFIVGAYNPWFYLYNGLYGMPMYGVFDPFLDYGFTGPTVWTTTTPSTEDKGVLHLEIKPRDAEVYIDGGLVGKANQFVGLFHKIRLDAGVHRLELRAPGYEPIVVNVRIQPGETMTYRGTLEKIAP
jgi:hypothetical protein